MLAVAAKPPATTNGEIRNKRKNARNSNERCGFRTLLEAKRSLPKEAGWHVEF